MDSVPAPVVSPPITPSPIAPTPPPKPFGVLAWMGIAMGVFVSVVRAWIWSGGVWTAEAYGYAFGGIVFPALIAYAIAGRRKVRNPNRFGLWFCGLCVVFYLLQFSRRAADPKGHVGELFKEAAGTKPVDRAGPPMDVLVRDVMRDILAEKKAYEAKADGFSAELGKIYSVETFASKEAIEKSIGAARGIVSVDQEYGRQLDTILERVQKRVDASPLSESDKGSFMKGLSSSYGNSKILADRREVMDAEQKWSEATVELYQLAESNLGKIHLKESQIVINDEKLRTVFNQRLEDSKKLQGTVAKLNEQLEQDRRAMAQEMGLTPKDIGVESGKPK